MLASAGCSSNNPEQQDDDAAKAADNTAEITGADEVVEEEDENQLLYDALPKNDYGGSDFSVLEPTHTDSEWFGELDGDETSVAVYKRNSQVEDDLSIKLNVISAPGLWGEESFLNRIRTSVAAADNSYQLVGGYAAMISAICQEHILANWNDAPDINFDAPWWHHDICSELQVNNKLYYITGDLSLTSLKYLMCLFFNKQIATDFGLNDIYEIVREGDWTIDKLEEYASKVAIDINGDGKMTIDDMYGYSTDSSNFITAFEAAFEADITVKDENGIPTLATGTEDFADKFTRVYNFINGHEYIYRSTNEGAYNNDLGRESTRVFVENRALFQANLLGNAAALREMEADFGIIPYPKYNDAQKDYHTTTWDAYNLFCVPVTADLSYTGVVTENLAAQSFRYIFPAFYETALRTKYARDNESADMIELIRNSATFNFGLLNSIHCGSIGHIFRNNIGSSNPNIASTFQKQVKAMTKALERFVNEAYFSD